VQVEKCKYDFDLKKLHQDKFEKRHVIGYGAIIDHFGNGNRYKKDDAQQQKFMRTCCLLSKATCLFLL